MRLDGAVVVVDEAHNLVATLPTRPNPASRKSVPCPGSRQHVRLSCCLRVLGKTLRD